ncbi:hypothetical protein [Bradyrhizobium elkanii]|uniref:hypothetical protein n=1 Tax=Bradyrhizobium elkanii TaxID=29448 RepID=UPI002714BCC5|nr:hypothetical protein [Bradyrhizobium elkanii]WLB84980.1 hypothetical protein QIH83_21485 [Bradyrhizobium elkanii]
MDPTMGQTSTYGVVLANEQQPTNLLPAPTETASVVSMSGYLNRADMQADQAAGTEASGLTSEIDNGALLAAAIGSQPVAETSEVFAADVTTEQAFAAITAEEPVVEALPAPEAPPSLPKYPVGKVDFNKPFEIYRTDDNQDFLTEVVILSVLADATHPVVIAGYHDNEGERLVLQFDLDGDDIRGDWVFENISTDPQTKFVRLFIDDERTLTVDETLYDSELAANREYHHGDVFGIFPIVIPPRVSASAIVEAAVVEGDGSDFNEEEEHDEAGDEDVAEVVEAAPPHPDAKWVNGRLIAPGQTVSAYRQRFGTRQVEVIKTRDHAYQTLFVKPQDGTNPYWALNKNIR